MFFSHFTKSVKLRWHRGRSLSPAVNALFFSTVSFKIENIRSCENKRINLHLMRRKWIVHEDADMGSCDEWKGDTFSLSPVRFQRRERTLQIPTKQTKQIKIFTFDQNKFFDFLKYIFLIFSTDNKPEKFRTLKYFQIVGYVVLNLEYRHQ